MKRLNIRTPDFLTEARARTPDGDQWLEQQMVRMGTNAGAFLSIVQGSLCHVGPCQDRAL